MVEPYYSDGAGPTVPDTPPKLGPVWGSVRSSVAPAQRSASAQAKASRHVTTSGEPACSFRDLLDHLATLNRDTIAIGGHQIDKITTPGPVQQRAFALLGTPIPTTLE